MSPIRSCAGCRVRRAQQTLIRLTQHAGHLHIDVSGELPGRGSYICPDILCLDTACRAGGLSRSFRAPVVGYDPRELAREIARCLRGVARQREEVARRYSGRIGSQFGAAAVVGLIELASTLEEGAAQLQLRSRSRTENKSRDRQQGKH